MTGFKRNLRRILLTCLSNTASHTDANQNQRAYRYPM